MSASALKRHATGSPPGGIDGNKAAKIDANDEPLMFEGKAASKVCRVGCLCRHANCLFPSRTHAKEKVLVYSPVIRNRALHRSFVVG